MTKKIKKLHINKKNNAINIFGLIAIFLVGFFALILLKQINHISGYTENKSEKTKQKVIKNKVKNISILLVGRGGGNHDAPDLTDTMILAKLNSKEKTISLLSIPRDLYVKYPTRGAGKLNSLYPTYYYKKNDKAYGMEILKEKITQITGEKIDYYVNVDFKGFKKTIDSIGGIEINVEKRLVDNKYPDYNWGYQTIIFEKGLQILNGERALQYARSRKTTSDYDRSLRQQQVIKAVKDKLTKKILDKGQKISDVSKTVASLYEIFKENVFTDISLKDAISIILDTKIFEGNFNFYSSNMNDTCYPGAHICEKGGIVYNPDISVFQASVELFNDTNPGNISNYKLSKKYSNIALNYPNIGKENYEINIFNSTKKNGLAWDMNYMIKRYGFNIPKKDFSGNTKEKYEKSVIYYNSIDKNSETMKALKFFFKGDFIETQAAKYSKNNAKIEIIIGSDYLKEKNLFRF